jgi:hypothetical protein
MMTKIIYWLSAGLILLNSNLAFACRNIDAGSLVFISVYFDYDDKETQFVAQGTGFIAHAEGAVLTAKHLVPQNFPTGAKVRIVGRLRSPNGNEKFDLTKMVTSESPADVLLLEFPRDAKETWSALKLGVKDSKRLNDNQVYVAWGFAFGGTARRHEAKISAMQPFLGSSLVEVDAPFAKGMSGGPVFNAKCQVIGVITSGASAPGFRYFTPLKYAEQSLSILSLPAEDTSSQDTPVAAYKSCRHPSNGVERWETVRSETRDSGWRSGGNDPQSYCGGAKIELERQNPEKVVALTSSSEDHKSEYTPFKHDYYKYTCQFKIQQAVYSERRSSACGFETTGAAPQ